MYYEEKDWPAYRIQIHALKSTSKMVGAQQLADGAKALEDAAAVPDEEAILRSHEGFIAAYRELTETIHRAVRANTES